MYIHGGGGPPLELCAGGKEDLLGHFHLLGELILGCLHELARKLRNHTHTHTHTNARKPLRCVLVCVCIYIAMQHAPAVQVLATG
jgi:hypothetical protein